MLDSIGILGTALKGIGWAFLPVLLIPLAILITRPGGFFSALGAQIISLIDAVNWTIGEIAKWALLAMVLLIVLSVVGLSIFGLSLTKLAEAPLYLNAAVIALGSAATLLAGQHVRVDVLYTKFSPDKRARLELIEFYLLLMPVCVILLWTAQSFVSGSWIAREASAESDGLGGLYLVKTLLPLFALLLLMQGLSVALRAALALTGQDRPMRPKGVPPLFGHIPSQDIS